MRFYNPEAFLILLPLLFVFLFWWLRDQKLKKQLREHFSLRNLERMALVHKERQLYSYLYRICLSLLALLLVCALARPQMGSKKVSEERTESSIIFVLDLSRSMLTKDISPSRLELTKAMILKSLKEAKNTAVGLVAFAGSVEVISPVTEDLSAVEAYVKSLSTNSIVSQGTQIRSALEEAVGLFERGLKEKSIGEKALVLFTDGEDHQQATINYVKSIYDKGYRLFTVGVGTEAGGYVPASEDSVDYLKDPSGQSVLSKPNFKFLKKMAEEGGGAFYFLSPGSDFYKKIYEKIDQFKSTVKKKGTFIVKNEVYQIFLAAAFFFLALAMLFRRLKK